MTVSRRRSDFRVRWIISTIQKCAIESRPSVLVIHLIRICAGIAFGAQLTGHLLTARAATSIAVWELAIFAVYLFNGVMDIHEDRVNGSRRPIATGALSRPAAVCATAGAAILALAGAALDGLEVWCAVAAVLVIGWQYSAPPGYLKRRAAGTAAAGAAMGFGAYFAGFAGQAGSAWLHPGAAAIAFSVTMSAWMAFVGAPAKDMSDVPGDAAAGRRTLPVLWGERTTRRAVACAALAISVASFGAAIYCARLLAWPAVALAAGAVTMAVISLNRISAGSRPRRRLPYRVFMITQYTTNICLLLAMLS